MRTVLYCTKTQPSWQQQYYNITISGTSDEHDSDDAGHHRPIARHINIFEHIIHLSRYSSHQIIEVVRTYYSKYEGISSLKLLLK